MDKFNWDLIMQEKTCVKIKNEKQFEKIKKEYEKKFAKGFYKEFMYGYNFFVFSNGHIRIGYYYFYRDNKKYFTDNDYTILKYKDVRIRKENIVCEKETFHDWLQSEFAGENVMEDSYYEVESSLLGSGANCVFYTDKEYTDFLVEKIIIKCIEYYNNMYSDKYMNCIFVYKDIDDYVGEKINFIELSNMFQKPSMIMNNLKVYENVKREMINFNGKNLLKYYFTGEF